MADWVTLEYSVRGGTRQERDTVADRIIKAVKRIKAPAGIQIHGPHMEETLDADIGTEF